MTDTDNGSNSASSLLSRTIGIAEYVAHSGRAVSVAELARVLDLPIPSAHRICKALAGMGILVRDPIAKGLRIGPRLSRLALETMLASADDGARRNILRLVVDETGETCTLTIMDGDEVLFLDRVESKSPLRLQLYAGSRVPLHCTSSGKLFLAFLPKSKRERFVRAAPLKRYTENTITDPESLQEELERIRQERVSTDNEEFVSGLVAVAVPVLDDKQRRMCAGVSVNAPAGRISIDKVARHVHALRRAAAALSPFFTWADQRDREQARTQLMRTAEM